MEKFFKNVKTIGFNVTFEGKGSVNNDSTDQRWVLSKLGLVGGGVPEKNTVFAKKHFIEDEDGNAKFNFKVSQECIRHDMYKDCMEFHDVRLGFIESIFYRAIAQKAFIERGYMFASKGQTVRKKSVFTITDAISEGLHSTVIMDTHSKSGERDKTSFYTKENVPNDTYHAEGMINLGEMQFISNDIAYDRNAVGVVGGSTNEKIYLDALNEEFGENPKFDFYYMKQSISKDEWAEEGVLLGKKAVDTMTKDIIKRIMNINITRTGSFFKFKGIELNVITEDNPDGVTIKIENPSDIDEYTFNYAEKYALADEKLIKKNKEKYEKLVEKKKKNSDNK